MSLPIIYDWVDKPLTTNVTIYQRSVNINLIILLRQREKERVYDQKDLPIVFQRLIKISAQRYFGQIVSRVRVRIWSQDLVQTALFRVQHSRVKLIDVHFAAGTNFIVSYIKLSRETGSMNPKRSHNEPSSEIIKFYLRRSNKKTIIVHSESPMVQKQLFELIHSKMNILMKDIVLYHEGRQVVNDAHHSMKKYFIKNLDILHVHDLQNIQKKELRITFKVFQCAIAIEQLVCIVAHPEQTIAQSLAKHVPTNKQLAFIQSGRKININNTYRQQHIQDESIIIITTFTKQDQPIAAVVEPPQPIEEPPKVEKPRPRQYEDMYAMNSTPAQLSLRRSVSWNSSDSCQLISFKKKKKSNMYKSMRTENRQTIWESDGSGEMSSKKLKSRIPYKKKTKNNAVQELKQEEEEQEHPDQESLLSSHERMQLRSQFSRLLNGDNIVEYPECRQKKQTKESQQIRENREEVTQLQPPQMMNNFDFMEETEEVEMGDLMGYEDQSDQDIEEHQGHQNQEDDDDDDDDDDDQDYRPMAQLTRSIGNSRGQYKAPMIPTKDTDKGQFMKN